MREAMLYQRLEDQRVQCYLCAHRCSIAPGRLGVCRVRENRDGVFYSLVYGRPISQAVDPIEKKPLFHVYPGSTSYSIATAGCNFRCSFCQNADISQMPRDRGRIWGREATPEAVVSAAKRTRSRTIAYTYTEPTVFFEYSYDIARLAHAQGIGSVYVTNGFMTREMLDTFQGLGNGHPPLLDAANVDLKAFRDETYKEVCGGRLQPVLDSLKAMRALGVWVEVTTLVVPGMNDDPAELANIAHFIAQDLGPEVPWHVSRFHPDYHMTDRGATPATVLRRAHEIGREAGLRYVYVGNMPGLGEDTLCPACDQVVIGRRGFRITRYRVQDGTCTWCGAPVDGVGL